MIAFMRGTRMPVLTMAMPSSSKTASNTVPSPPRVYDANGRVTSSTLPQDTSTSPVRETTYTYEAVGNQLTTTSANGNVSGAAAGSYTTTTAYDALDQPTTVSDAAGNKI